MSPSMISFEIAVPNISITDYLNFFTSYSLSRFQSTNPFFKGTAKIHIFLFLPNF